MNSVMLIARAEWRYWLRSSLAVSAAVLFLLLLILTTVLSTARFAAERHERLHHQQDAEESFLSQPDRHPHRMVHYGHYVFRTPTPLSVFDPGLDPVTGQSVFLEGHRQNSATFAESSSGADLGGLSWITPAVVYQIFGPVLIILLGHGAVVREREAATLGPMMAQGVSGAAIMGGKALALLAAIGILLLPLLASALVAVGAGESWSAAFLLFGLYLAYLAVWALLSLLVSALLPRRATVLATLTALWLALTLLLPFLAVSNSAVSRPIAGQIESDLTMLADLRRQGDGHNAEDPAFQQLRGELLARYDADSVEELPVNWRGVVAEYSEAKLTETLNAYAEARMAAERGQAELLATHSWLTPTLATAVASRAIAATGLETYHRFLRDAEALRIDFVQGLNRLHAEELDYRSDVNRNRDAAAARRARISAGNWKLLSDFRFEAADVAERVRGAATPSLSLACWIMALLVACAWTSGRLRP